MKENLLPFNVNKNGRIYDKDSYDWSKLKDLSDAGTLFGELGTRDESLLFDVSLSRVSHHITDIEVYDDGVYGKINVLDTERGKILKTLLDEDYELNVSSRATGKVENGITIINKLISFDYIVSPIPKLESRRKKLDRILNKIDERS